MLRVAFDLSGGREGGTGRGTYIRSLLLALAAVDTGNQYALYGYPGLKGDIDRGNFRYRRYEDLEGIQVWHFPDLISPYLREHMTPAARRAGGARGERVVTVHDVLFDLFPEDFAEGTRRAFQAGLAAAAGAGATFIVPSEWAAATLLERGVPPDRVRVVPLGAGLPYAPCRDPEALASLRRRYGLERPFLLFVGGAFSRKNLAAAVRAFHLLRDRKRVPHQLVAVGTSRRAARTLMAAAGLDPDALDPDVVCLGAVPDGDMPLFYNAADLLVHPSLAEGFGLPVLEAMACGLPVVSSCLGAMPEVAGDAAMLVDPRQPEEIAAAAARLLSDRELRARLGRLGQERARGFTWDRTARETVAVYASVAGRTAEAVTFVPGHP